MMIYNISSCGALFPHSLLTRSTYIIMNKLDCHELSKCAPGSPFAEPHTRCPTFVTLNLAWSYMGYADKQ